MQRAIATNRYSAHPNVGFRYKCDYQRHHCTEETITDRKCSGATPTISQFLRNYGINFKMIAYKILIGKNTSRTSITSMNTYGIRKDA